LESLAASASVRAMFYLLPGRPEGRPYTTFWLFSLVPCISRGRDASTIPNHRRYLASPPLLP
jgi:hypothetical protein